MARTIGRNVGTAGRHRGRIAVVALSALAVATLLVGQPTEALPQLTVWSETTAGVQVNGTYTPIVGSFTGPDKVDDILWYSSTGTDQFWKRTTAGNTFTSGEAKIQLNGTKVPIVGDFAGNDNLDDILLYGPGTSQDLLLRSKGDGSFSTVAATINGTYTPVVIPSDSGDDILWWRPGGTSHSIWAFNGTAGTWTTKTMTSATGAVPIAGDFQGSNNGAVFWYAPGTTPETLWLFTGSSWTQSGKAPPNVGGSYRPIVVSVAGIGQAGADQILWHSSTSPNMSIWSMSTGLDWTSTPVQMQTSSKTTPIPMPLGTNTYVWSWDTAGEDHLWAKLPDGPVDFGTPNTEIPAGYRAIPLQTNGLTQQILWYAPGSTQERLFTAV